MFNCIEGPQHFIRSSRASWVIWTTSGANYFGALLHLAFISWLGKLLRPGNCR